MSSFDVTELRRLSEAATPEDDALDAYTSMRRLTEYTFQHRERILAMLEAADALAEAASEPTDALADIAYEGHHVYIDNCRNAIAAYEAAKGGE